MSNFLFESQGTNTYLVYQIGEDEMIDTTGLGMITYNKIPGLLPALFYQMDTTKYIKYNVSAKISVKQLFSGPVNKKRLMGVFLGITDAILSAEEYMIDVNSILLDLEYMFADVSTCETTLICLPIIKQETSFEDMGAFFRNIIFTTQFDQTENCDHVAKIINFLNMSQVFSISNFKSLLEEIKNSATPLYSEQKEKVPEPQPPASKLQPRNEKQQSVSAMTENQPSVQQQQPRSQSVVQQPMQQVKTEQSSNNLHMEAETNEKDISMFYLLQHYNSENAAIYKAQKAAKKARKAQSTQTATPADGAAAYDQASKQNAKKKQKAKSKQQQQQATSFAVPGAPAANTNFVIPGQPPQGVPGNVVLQQNTVSVQNTVPAHNIQQTMPQNQAPAMTQARAMGQQQALQPSVYTQPVPQGQTMNFGETTVLSQGNIGETTVLSAIQDQTASQPYLIRSRNNEKIMLDKPVYRIGKEKSYVDYFVSDNTAVSRSHANIINRDGVFYVMDTNSTNHTYVNGAMIQSNLETKLEQGTKIRLANEEFVFYLH